MLNRSKLRWAALVALMPLVSACGGLLDVESPGRIADEDLATPDAIPGMIAGMKYDLSRAVDGMGEFLALAGMELFHGGSYAWADVPRGIWTEEDIGGEWSNPQRARWVAESGLERLREGELLTPEQFARSPFAAEAYVYAGFSNRIMGDNFCSSVIDGGEEVSNTVHYDRGIGQFTEAIAVATAAGRTDLVHAAYAGRAHMKAMTGDWAGGAADAAQVPTDFVFYAEIDTELRNELTYETHNRFEYTVWGTYMEDHPDDPRAPWEILYDNAGQVRRGANGATFHYQQKKYTDPSSDVPLTKGTEMLILRAEAALRAGDIGAAYTHMNAVRAFHSMDALTPAASTADAWADLRFERGATLWLEGRRLGDLRRWAAEGAPMMEPSLGSRQSCIPISQAERLSNPNLRG